MHHNPHIAELTKLQKNLLYALVLRVKGQVPTTDTEKEISEINAELMCLGKL